MVRVQSFDSAEDMFKALDDAMKEADKRIQPFQRLLAPGMYFLAVSDDMDFVYGEVLYPAEDEEMYQEERMQGYRLTRCHSKYCPEGEEGDTHISTVACVLTKDIFEEAKASGWPGAEELLAKDMDDESKRELLRIRHAIINHIDRAVMGGGNEEG